MNAIVGPGSATADGGYSNSRPEKPNSRPEESVGALRDLIEQGKELQKKVTDLIAQLHRAGRAARKIERRKAPR